MFFKVTASNTEMYDHISANLFIQRQYARNRSRSRPGFEPRTSVKSHVTFVTCWSRVLLQHRPGNPPTADRCTLANTFPHRKVKDLFYIYPGWEGYVMCPVICKSLPVYSDSRNAVCLER